MIGRLLAALALALTGLVVFGQSPAYACRCQAEVPVSDHVAGAEVVFVGELVRTVPAANPSELTTFEVEVGEELKGDVDDRATVVTPGTSSACGIEGLPAGQPIVWFAGTTALPDDRGNTVPEGAWLANSCGGTQVATDALVTQARAAAGVPDPTPGVTPQVGADSSASDSESDDDGIPAWLTYLGVGALAVAGVVAGRLTARLVSRRRAEPVEAP